MRRYVGKRSISKHYPIEAERTWWSANWWVVLALIGICVLALFLRTYFTIEPALRHGFQLSGGSDSYYHKHCIDHIIATHTHLVYDPLLNFPFGASNPRPPLFDWSIAVMGMILAPFLNGDLESAVWWSTEFAATFWATLTILPIYFITKEIFGRKAGLFSALLMAITAGHIERGHFGFADHDPMVLFFVVLSSFFFLKAVKTLNEKRWVAHWRDLQAIIIGISNYFHENKIAVGYAVMAGLSIGSIGLIWKGFSYVVVIIFLYSIIQFIIYRVRNIDIFSIYVITIITMATCFIFVFPCYGNLGPIVYGSWITTFHLLTAIVVFGGVLVFTRDQPWLVVLPTLIGVCIGGLSLLYYISPVTFAGLTSGGGYFIRTKLYTTIAEAQAPAVSRLIVSFGIVTFFLTLIGLCIMVKRFPKQWSSDFLFIIIWCGAAIYMAMSAVRFMFNATPVFAILAGWIATLTVQKIDYPGMIKSMRTLSGNKLHAFRKSVKLRHIFGTLLIVFGILIPNLWLAVDAGIPYESKRKYDPEGKFLGAFGMSFPADYWRAGYHWLSQQDTNLSPEDRPAFISWWDYGFECIGRGKHPTVADNFQFGYQLAGSFISAQTELEGIALLTARLIEGHIGFGRFNENVYNILVKYVGEENAAGILDAIRNSEKYVKIVKSDPEKYGKYIDLLPGNARYAYIRVILTSLGEEQLINLLHEIEVETGDSIRYFAVDYRLFPFSARNTGIFYAPIKLADKDINDFLGYIAITTKGEMSIEEAEKEAERDPDFRIKDYKLDYLEPFYRSMFYRCYIGYSGLDLGMGKDAGIPALSGELRNYPPMQGWNMSHFRLVYRTMYWSPKSQANATFPDDYEAMNEVDARKMQEEHGGHLLSGLRMGVFIIKYYDGAYVRGRVVTSATGKVDETCKPLAGVRVTVQDEYGIPHGCDFTDENGEYNVTVPFGEVKLVVSKGGQGEGINYQKLYGIETRMLNTTTLTITDAQAMRIAPDWIIERDITVKPGKLNGTVYWDVNEDDKYNSDKDEYIPFANITLRSKDQPGHGQPVYTTIANSTGWYAIDELVPGKYELAVCIAGHNITHSTDIEFDPGVKKTEDIGIKPATINGTVSLMIDGVSISLTNISVELIDVTPDALGYKLVVTTNDTGYYEFTRLLPGDYNLTVAQLGFAEYTQAFKFDEGQHEIANITLAPVVPITGKVLYEDTLKPRAHVEFIPVNGKGTSTTRSKFIADRTGRYYGNLTSGNYTVWVLYSEDMDKYVHLGQVEIKPTYAVDETMLKTRRALVISNLTIAVQEYDIKLVRGVRVNGTVVDPKGENMSAVTIEFERGDRETPDGMSSGKYYESPRALAIPTNSIGAYQTYLPPGSYQVKITTSASVPAGIAGAALPTNITYYVYIALLQIDEDDIWIEHNIRLQPSIKVQGCTYWDKNQDGKYTITIENVSERIEEIETRRNDDEPNANGDDYDSSITTTRADDEDEEPELLIRPEVEAEGEEENITYEPLEEEVLEEAIGAVLLEFKCANGTWRIGSDASTGKYEIYLAPADYELAVIGDARIVNSIYELDLSTEAVGEEIYYNVSVVPRKINVSGVTWYDANMDGVLDKHNESVSNISIEFIAESIGAVNVTVVSDSDDGTWNVSLLPGKYKIQVYDEKIELATNITYGATDSIELMLGSSPLTYNIELAKKLKVNGTVYIVNASVSNVTVQFKLLSKPYNLCDYNNYVFEIVTVVNLTTDREGMYSGYILPGRYIVEVKHTVGNDTYIHLETYDIMPGYAKLNLPLELAVKLSGTAYFENKSIGELQIVFVGAGIISVNTTSEGYYEVYLPPNRMYSVFVNHTVTENVTLPANNEGSGDTKRQVSIRYIWTDNITVGNFSVTYNIYLEQLIKVTGTVYYDENGNEVIDATERLANVTVEFIPIGNDKRSTQWLVVTNATGYYELYLPRGDYYITVDCFGYRPEPAEPELNVSLINATTDLALIPSNITVAGWIYYDKDYNLTFDDDELPITTKVTIEFIVVQDEGSGQNKTLQLDSIPEGYYNTTIQPGSYNVYAYKRINNAKFYVAIGKLEVKVATPTEYNISMQEGLRLTGTVYYYNTDNILVDDISGELTFEHEDTGGKKTVTYHGGYYKIYLAYGNYTVTSKYVVEEYDMNMTYAIDERYEITDDYVSQPLFIELKKEVKYEVEVELISDDSIDIEPGETITYKFRVKNLGNVEDTINIKQYIPSGWTEELSATAVDLWLGESVIVTATLYTPEWCYALNTITIEGKSAGDPGRKSTDKLIVKTSKIYGFEMYAYSDVERGVNFESTVEYKIAIKQTGNCVDTIEISVADIPENWTAKLVEDDTNRESDISADAPYKLHLPQEATYKNITFKLTTPNSTVGEKDYRQARTIYISGKSQNSEQAPTKITLTATLIRPELTVTDIKVSNLRLTDGNNITVNATIACTYVETKDVIVQFAVDDKVVSNRTISIGEDSTTNVVFEWDASKVKGKPIDIKIWVDPEDKKAEEDDTNNWLIKTVTPGPPKLPPEFNWRPIIFFVAIIIIIIVIIVLWKRRRKV